MSIEEGNTCGLARANKRIEALEIENARLVVLVRDIVLPNYEELLTTSGLGSPETSPTVAAMRALAIGVDWVSGLEVCPLCGVKP